MVSLWNQSCYLLRPLCAELATLNMQHQITTADVFHDEVDSGLGLETSVQVQQEGMSLLVGNKKDALFGSCALDFIVLNDELLLQYFDGIQLLGCFGLGEHDLTKVSLTQYGKEIEVIQADTHVAALGLARRWPHGGGRLACR